MTYRQSRVQNQNLRNKCLSLKGAQIYLLALKLLVSVVYLGMQIEIQIDPF